MLSNLSLSQIWTLQPHLNVDCIQVKNLFAGMAQSVGTPASVCSRDIPAHIYTHMSSAPARSPEDPDLRLESLKCT